MRKIFFILILLLLFTAIAYGEDARCPEVRAKVSQYGVVRAAAWARSQGYTEAQIKEARQCLIRRRIDILLPLRSRVGQWILNPEIEVRIFKG